MQRLANPLRFRRLSSALLPWTGAAAVLLLAAGTWLSLAGSPRDYQQGETVRIMYVHVPAAWMAMFTYANLAIASAVGLLWGKPMWGTWWVWDARLTSVLLLFLLYLGYIALANAFEDEARGTRAASILALVGAINLPVIKFSVDWWNTLHQPASVSRLDAPALHPSMLPPLLVMALAFMAWFATVLLWRIEAALAERRLAARRMLAEAGTATPAMRR
jgi:heme exporter protein C